MSKAACSQQFSFIIRYMYIIRYYKLIIISPLYIYPPAKRPCFDILIFWQLVNVCLIEQTFFLISLMAIMCFLQITITDIEIRFVMFVLEGASKCHIIILVDHSELSPRFLSSFHQLFLKWTMNFLVIFWMLRENFLSLPTEWNKTIIKDAAN